MAQIRAVVVALDTNLLHYGHIDNVTNNFYYDGNWQSRVDDDDFYHPTNRKIPETNIIKAGKYTAL